MVDNPAPGHGIREASVNDWPAIWSFLREIMRAGDTYTWSTHITEDEARVRWFLPPPWRVFVAVAADGEIAGTAEVGPNLEGPGAHVANTSFMVNPNHFGSGVGRALGEHIFRVARELGYRAVQFNAVVETNTRAVALWRSLGFDTRLLRPVGAVTLKRNDARVPAGAVPARRCQRHAPRCEDRG